MLMLGKEYPNVHALMDSRQPDMQSTHRAFFHDDQTVGNLYLASGDFGAAWSAYYHIWLDHLSDRYGKNRCIYELVRCLVIGETAVNELSVFVPLVNTAPYPMDSMPPLTNLKFEEEPVPNGE